MIKVQNLTKKNLILQGIIIPAYSSVDFDNVYDYVALSRLTNSGRVRYTSVTKKPVIAAPVEVVKQEEVSEKEVAEPVEEVVEETVTEAEPVVEEEPKEEPKQEAPQKKYSNKKRKDSADK